MYISGVPFEQLDFPTNLSKGRSLKRLRDSLGAVPVVLTVWPAFFGWSMLPCNIEVALIKVKK